MTTTFLFVRHAAHDNVGGFLAGRLPNIRLGADGRAQAARLAERMRRESFSAIISSPRERTRETADAIGAACNRPVSPDPALEEIDFGSWSGKTFVDLNEDAAWRQWNAERATARTPSGEGMADVRERVLGCMERVARDYPSQAVVLVSHADVIKAAVCHHLGLGLDAGAKLEVSPASITTLVVGAWGAKLWQLNETIA